MSKKERKMRAPISEKEKLVRRYLKEFEKKQNVKVSEAFYKEKYAELAEKLYQGSVSLAVAQAIVDADCEWKSIQEVFALEEVPHHEYKGSFLIRDREGRKHFLDAGCKYAITGKTEAISLPEPTKVRHYFFIPTDTDRQIYSFTAPVEIMGIMSEANELPVDMRQWPKRLVNGYFMRKYSNHDGELPIEDRMRSRDIFQQDKLADKLHQIRQINLSPSKRQLEKIQKEKNEDKEKVINNTGFLPEDNGAAEARPFNFNDAPIEAANFGRIQYVAVAERRARNQ